MPSKHISLKQSIIVIFVLLSLRGISLGEDSITQLAQAASSGQSVPSTLPKLGMEERISLDLRSIEIVEALKFLAIKSGLNIIATKNVAGRVTLMVEDVPLKDIFDIMLRSNGLAYVKEGEIYNVMTEEEYKTLFGKNFYDIRQVRVFRLNYAIPEKAFTLIDTIKSEIGRVLVEEDSGTVLIMDTPEKIEEIEEALATLEKENLVRVFTLKYALAKDAEERLKTQLNVKNVGTVLADERSNQLIVQTLPDRMAEIERLIAALDSKTREVLIDSKIVKVKLSDQLDAGIDWEGLVRMGGDMGFGYFGSTPFSVLQSGTEWISRKSFLDNNMTGSSVGAYPFSGNTASLNTSTKVAPGERMHIGTINEKRDIDVLIKYLQTIGNTQILANPKLAVINNQEAKIHIGERQAYVTTTTTTGQATSTISEEVTFIDVGIQLAVTPTINNDGYVTMKIKPEISSVVDSYETPSGNTIPIVDTSMAETTVMVKEGVTIVIGGLRRDDKTDSSEGVPFLSKIPLLGFLFKSETKKIERTELLVMMTPHIVTGDRLTTGDERDFGDKPGKEYKDYSPFADETDFEMPTETPEEKIKPYRKYSRE